MKHEEVKKQLSKDPEVKKEYEKLKVLYDIKREIIKLRIEQGLSQQELADKVGTKQSAISRLENGEYNPSIDFLNKVAKALGKELLVKFN
jgi:ribosome-binding protein aMBF1 (putative translation factor)